MHNSSNIINENISNSTSEDGIHLELILNLYKSSLPKLNNSTIHGAVNDWFNGVRPSQYGHISTWDVSGVTDILQLFENLVLTGDDDLSGWDTSNVTNMENMFMFSTGYEGHGLKPNKFNTWDVSNVVHYHQFHFNSSIPDSRVPPSFL